MSTASLFKNIKNKHNDCIKKFFKSLREHALKINNFKSESSEKQQKSFENAKMCNISKEKFQDEYIKYKKYHKVGDHCHYTGQYRSAAYSICNLKYSIPKEIPVVFENGLNYDYHFIMKEQAEEFKGQFTCSGKNTKKYITFSVSIKEKLKELVKMEKKLQKPYLTLYSIIMSRTCSRVNLHSIVA